MTREVSISDDAKEVDVCALHSGHALGRRNEEVGEVKRIVERSRTSTAPACRSCSHASNITYCTDIDEFCLKIEHRICLLVGHVSQSFSLPILPPTHNEHIDIYHDTANISNSHIGRTAERLRLSNPR